MTRKDILAMCFEKSMQIQRDDAPKEILYVYHFEPSSQQGYQDQYRCQSL
jgi:hypothetical protein